MLEKVKNFFSPRRLSLIMTAIVFVISLSVINKPSQSTTQGIVAYIAVDRVDGQIEMSCAVITPVGQKGGKTNTYSARAESIAQAEEIIGIQLGKDLGFAQCELLAVGQNLVEYGVTGTLNFFIRTKKIDKNILFMTFDGKTNEFIDALNYMREELSLDIGDVLDNNKKALFTYSSNLENFYLGFYAKTGISIAPKISVSEEDTGVGIKVEIQDTSNSSSSQNSSGLGGDGTSQQGGKKTVYFVNDGATTVFKIGKKINEISPDLVSKLNLLNEDVKFGKLRINNVTDKIFDDADIVLDLGNKTLKQKYFFENGVPVVKFSIEVNVKIDEVIEETKNEKLLKREDALITNEVVRKLEEKIDRDVKEAVRYMLVNNIDLLNIYSNFEKFQNKKWAKYIGGLEDETKFLQQIDFRFDIRVGEFL